MAATTTARMAGDTATEALAAEHPLPRLNATLAADQLITRIALPLALPGQHRSCGAIRAMRRGLIGMGMVWDASDRSKSHRALPT